MSKQDGILGGPAPYGYLRRGIGSDIKINRAEARTVQLIFSLREQGVSLAGVARYLNVVAKVCSPDGSGQWWPATVQRIIKSKRRYVGGRIRRLSNGAKWPAILGVDLDAEPEPEPEPVEPPKPAKRRHVARKMRQLKTL